MCGVRSQISLAQPGSRILPYRYEVELLRQRCADVGLLRGKLPFVRSERRRISDSSDFLVPGEVKKHCGEIIVVTWSPALVAADHICLVPATFCLLRKHVPGGQCLRMAYIFVYEITGIASDCRNFVSARPVHRLRPASRKKSMTDADFYPVQ